MKSLALLLFIAWSAQASYVVFSFDPPSDTNGIIGYAVCDLKTGYIYGQVDGAGTTSIPCVCPYGAVCYAVSLYPGTNSAPSNLATNTVMSAPINFKKR